MGKGLATLGVAVVVIAGSLVATPAFADSGSNSTGGSPDVAATASLTSAQASTTDQIVDRINQLVAAYDPSAKTFDSSKVPAATLASDEGKAFIAAVTLGQDGATSAASDVEAIFTTLRQELVASGSPMTAETDDNPFASSFSLAPGVTVTYPDETMMTPQVSGGADPFPYIQLTNPEQQAMVTGSSATLILAICALLGPETGGVGCAVGGGVVALIVGIIVANGVCPNNREMRIYPLLGPAGFSCQ